MAKCMECGREVKKLIAVNPQWLVCRKCYKKYVAQNGKGGHSEDKEKK